ncbi:choice-of-anchor D domain-containing protein [Burkholderia multivorans]|uniref:choice-of-anchor D domain-containing protein n=1 Tax=Burkholderia multivorans TaxID=87883 RepID=UPI001C2277E2|nr:choice-of-anchor D domain-containing protein [Burkholderia multivorans]MBU9199965.1 choice-of-anchor D domain-containing protein [Burkholderia multivorans]MDN8078916.1 choice-of-anchor D domain-containing protein [Burkholderia multivorans]
MKIRNLLAAAALSVLASSIFASDYYVVVPVPGKTTENSYNKGSLVLSSPLLNFGTRQRGEAGVPLPLELTNVSTVPLTVTGMTIADAGVADGYSVQTDCSVLAPSASCDAYVYYRPIVAGTHVSTLTITHNGKGGAKVVTLQGISTDPSASLAIGDFGAVNVGSAKDLIAVFTNTGIGNLAVGTPSTSGAGFSIVSDDCPSPLPPANSCNITTRFTAQNTSNQIGVLTVPSGAGAITARLSGTGLSSNLQFTSGPVAGYGSVSVGTTVASKTITLKNSGNLAADGLALSVSGTTGYTIENSTCGTTLGAGAACTFDVRFSPNAPGAYLGDLNATVNGQVLASSPLSGVGTSAAISITPSSATAYVVVGMTNPVYYTFTNSSNSPVTITSKSLTVSDPNLIYAFTPGAGECGTVVPAQSSCKINMTMQAADSFVFKAQTFTLNTSAGQLTDSRMNVGGSWAKLSPSPANPSFSFGNVVVGASALSTKVKVTDMSIFGNPDNVTYQLPDGFSLDSSSCGAVLNRTASCEFYVKFSPTAAKTYSGNFTMTTNTQPNSSATGTPQPFTLSIPLSGVGVAPAAISWQGGVTGVVEQGESRAFTMTLYNPAAAAISLGSVNLSGNTSEFQLNSTTCKSSLAANSSCTAALTFAPTGAGARPTATLSVTAGGNAVSTVLSATAGTAVLTSPTTSLPYASRYALGSGVFNAFSDLTVTVTDSGAAAAENLTTSITYNDSKLSFSFQNNSCVNRLNAGVSCTATIRAQGSVIGTHTGTVNFQSASGLLQIPFTFTIVPMDIGVTTVTAVQDTTVGKGTVSKYTVNTTATGQVIVQPPTISGNTSEYSLASGTNCNGTVAVNSSCTINVLFTPTAIGARPQGKLNVNVGGVMRTVTLTGSGLSP